MQWLRAHVWPVLAAIGAALAALVTLGYARRLRRERDEYRTRSEHAARERDAARVDADRARGALGETLERNAEGFRETVREDAEAEKTADEVLHEVLDAPAEIPVEVVGNPFAEGAEERARILRGEGES